MEKENKDVEILTAIFNELFVIPVSGQYVDNMSRARQMLANMINEKKKNPQGENSEKQSDK